MKKLVTISREYGSGGRIIGRIIAEKLGVPFYDKEIIDMAVEKSGLSREVIETAELRAKSNLPILCRLPLTLEMVLQVTLCL
jgi:cytidylate kinase